MSSDAGAYGSLLELTLQQPVININNNANGYNNNISSNNNTNKIIPKNNFDHQDINDNSIREKKQSSAFEIPNKQDTTRGGRVVMTSGLNQINFYNNNNNKDGQYIRMLGATNPATNSSNTDLDEAAVDHYASMQFPTDDLLSQSTEVKMTTTTTSSSSSNRPPPPSLIHGARLQSQADDTQSKDHESNKIHHQQTSSSNSNVLVSPNVDGPPAVSSSSTTNTTTTNTTTLTTDAASLMAHQLRAGSTSHGFCRGLRDFQAETENELSFKKGDIIFIVDKSQAHIGWWAVKYT